MVRRAVKENQLAWVAVFITIAGLILSHPGRALPVLISTLAFLPAVYLVTGWEGSVWKRGLCRLVSRSGGSFSVNAAEVSLPFLSGTLLSTAVTMAAYREIPWQYWVVTPLSTLAFSLLYISSERHFRHQGRFGMALLWAAWLNLSESSSHTARLLVFTGYPGEALCCTGESGSPHPDTFILASILFLGISSGVYAWSHRSRAASARSE